MSKINSTINQDQKDTTHPSFQQKSLFYTTAATIQNSILNNQSCLHDIQETLQQRDAELQKAISLLELKDQLLAHEKMKNEVLQQTNRDLKLRNKILKQTNNVLKLQNKDLKNLIAGSGKPQGYELKKSRSEKNFIIQPKSEEYINLINQLNEKIGEIKNLRQMQMENGKVVKCLLQNHYQTERILQGYEFPAPEVIHQGDNLCNLWKLPTEQFKGNSGSSASNSSSILSIFKKRSENSYKENESDPM